MFDYIFRGVFDSEWAQAVQMPQLLLCTVFALILGAVIAMCFMFKSAHSQSSSITLALLPAVVCVVIMLVNGNIGAGVAVAGAFSLVRFRSAAGTAKDICSLFFAMSAGLICGMGYLGFACIFTLLICAVYLVYMCMGFGLKKADALSRTVRIMIPEDLDYTGVFDDVFSEYLSSFELTGVKTTNMGSMFRLTYDIVLKDSSKEKEMIDRLRCRNGNLEIGVSRTAENSDF